MVSYYGHLVVGFLISTSELQKAPMWKGDGISRNITRPYYGPHSIVLYKSIPSIPHLTIRFQDDHLTAAVKAEADDGRNKDVSFGISGKIQIARLHFVCMMINEKNDFQFLFKNVVPSFWLICA